MIDRGLYMLLVATKVVVGGIWVVALVPLLAHKLIDAAGNWLYAETTRRVWRKMCQRKIAVVLRKYRAACRVHEMQKRIAQAEEFVRGFAGDN